MELSVLMESTEMFFDNQNQKIIELIILVGSVGADITNEVSNCIKMLNI